MKEQCANTGCRAEEILKDSVINLTKENFLLWMFISQEGYFDEAYEFIWEKRCDPTPVTNFINLGLLHEQLWAACKGGM